MTRQQDYLAHREYIESQGLHALIDFHANADWQEGLMSFRCDERTVMSADLLLMEPTFLPGTFILVDGRTNNARFLQRNFQREYRVTWDREGDATSFELMEERLGKHNLLGSDFFGPGEDGNSPAPRRNRGKSGPRAR